MADVVDDRLIGDAADVLHVIIGLGRIRLLLLVSRVDTLQNADATRRHLLTKRPLPEILERQSAF